LVGIRQLSERVDLTGWIREETQMCDCVTVILNRSGVLGKHMMFVAAIFYRDAN
jgi:hypothetical protein